MTAVLIRKCKSKSCGILIEVIVTFLQNKPFQLVKPILEQSWNHACTVSQTIPTAERTGCELFVLRVPKSTFTPYV